MIGDRWVTDSTFGSPAHIVDIVISKVCPENRGGHIDPKLWSRVHRAVAQASNQRRSDDLIEKVICALDLLRSDTDEKGERNGRHRSNFAESIPSDPRDRRSGSADYSSHPTHIVNKKRGNPGNRENRGMQRGEMGSRSGSCDRIILLTIYS